ncbi:protein STRICTOSIDINE SYNTHASE-LIKE 12-like [Mangifera indica]|uniref:protein STRICTOSIDINE SYNTHASE-LIKE 12-like n=1 Tax=Mangifera indica TaxID=29780 RepID=UPI001CFA130A|nr:protein STRICTOSIDINE SYNTHASE-LIKE 12-like [Mangifera indica]
MYVCICSGMSMLFSISLFFLLSLPSVTLSFKSTLLPLPSNTSAPEALAFDPAGAGPYTGVSDGRILKYLNPRVGFVDFAVSNPTRSKLLCDGSNSTKGPACGRPLGLEFNVKTGILYVADAYFGLVSVATGGGVATQLATSAENVPFRFLNALDIDQDTGIVYFVDTSTKFPRGKFNEGLLSKDKTGRLMKYDPETREVTVLQRKLGMPTGVAVSKAGNFLLYTEAVFGRAQKFWLTGPKAKTSEIFATFEGRGDNIKRNGKGEFWIPDNSNTTSLGKRFGEDGKVLETVTLSEEPAIRHSEVQEFEGKIYLVSAGLNVNYVKILCG